jgi:hypothetical protein
MRGGIDQGFCINYWRLSFRRKSIRDVLSTFIGIGLLVWLYLWRQWEVLLGAIPLIALLGAWSVFHNYRQWRTDQRLTELLAGGTATAWRMLVLVNDGVELPISRMTLMFVTNDSYRIFVNGREIQAGMARVIPNTDPPQSDILVGSGPNAGQTLPQITKIEGDVMIGCAARSDGVRPTEFASPPGSGHTLSAWIRIR